MNKYFIPSIWNLLLKRISNLYNMSDERLGGLMINRLLVLIQVIMIPVYFIFFSLRWKDNIQSFFDSLSSSWLSFLLPPWLVWFEVNLAIPILFSLPWVLFSIIRATRIADAYELMGRALGKVRIDQKLFYGLNAAFTLLFIVFPFGSPLITILGIMVIVKIIMQKALIGRLSKWFWILPALTAAFFPFLIAYAFYSNYSVLWDLVLDFWLDQIPTLFGIGLCLAIAIAIGNFFLFLFEGGVKYGNYENVPYGIIFVLKLIGFGLLTFVYFNTNPPTIVNFVNYIAVGLGIFEIVMRRLRDLPTEGKLGSGIVMVIAFSIVNIIINAARRSTGFTAFIQTLVVVLSGMIFFVLFWLSYKYADDDELFE